MDEQKQDDEWDVVFPVRRDPPPTNRRIKSAPIGETMPTEQQNVALPPASVSNRVFRSTAIPQTRPARMGRTAMQVLRDHDRAKLKPGEAEEIERVHRNAMRYLQRQALTVSHPNDPAEKEADEMADRVMRFREGREGREGVGLDVGREGQVSRSIEGKREDEEAGENLPIRIAEGVSRTPTADEDLSVSRESAEQIARVTSSGGKPLENAGFFEERMGADFSRVRVHTGPEAAKAAEGVQAKAFTLGREVVFGEGQYRPETSDGQRLIAHELTHTIQQGAARMVAARMTRRLQRSPILREIPRQIQRNVRDMRGAIAYNEQEHDFTPGLVAKLHSIVGDARLRDATLRAGRIGPEFVNLVAAVQTRVGAGVDGRLGPRTIQLGEQYLATLTAESSQPPRATTISGRITEVMLDGAIGALNAMPAPILRMQGALGPVIRQATVGFLQKLRAEGGDTAFRVAWNLATASLRPAYAWGYLKGFLYGFFVDGLLGPFIMLYDMVQIAGMLGQLNQKLQGWLFGPEGLPSLIPDQQAMQTAAEWIRDNAPKIASEIREQATAGKIVGLVQSIVVGLQTMLENAANEAGKAIATKIVETFRQPTEQSDGEIGYTVGSLSGQVIFEIILGVLTAGVGAAVAAGKAGIRAVVQGLREVLRVLGVGRRGQRFAVDAVLFAYRHLRGYSNYVKAVFAGWLEKSPALQRLYNGVLHLIDRVWSFVERLKRRIDEALEKRRRRSEADAPERPRDERPDGDDAPDGDRTPDQRRQAAVAEAYALVAAEDVRGASVAEVLALLKTRFLRRGRGISDFGYHRVGADRYDFWYKASPPKDLYNNFTEDPGKSRRLPDPEIEAIEKRIEILRRNGTISDRQQNDLLRITDRLRRMKPESEARRTSIERLSNKLAEFEPKLSRLTIRPGKHKTTPMQPMYAGEERNSRIWAGRRVTYLESEADRAPFEIFVDPQNGLLYTSSGQLFDTRFTPSPFGRPQGDAIFVMDDSGRIFASTYYAPGEVHHSTFLAGSPVAAAGHITVKAGLIVERPTRRSGHYRPDEKMMDQFFSELQERGARFGWLRNN